jgi:hypothetical protein
LERLLASVSQLSEEKGSSSANPCRGKKIIKKFFMSTGTLTEPEHKSIPEPERDREPEPVPEPEPESECEQDREPERD